MTVSYNRVTPAEFNPGDNDWKTIDANTYGVPATGLETGAQLCIYYNTSEDCSDIDIRPNGASLDLNAYFCNQLRIYRTVKLDANGVFEVNNSSYTKIDWFIVGYFLSPWTFNSERQDYSTATSGSYQTVDVTSDTSSNTSGVICWRYTTGSTDRNHAIHAVGSSDDFYGDADTNRQHFSDLMVKTDSSQAFEQKIEDTTCDLYLIAYYDGTSVVFYPNGLDRSLGSTGSYYDLTALPNNSKYGMYWICASSSTYNAALQKKGTSDGQIYDFETNTLHSMFVECDTSYLVEGQIEHVSVDFYEMGYGLEESTFSPRNPAAIFQNPAII